MVHCIIHNSLFLSHNSAPNFCEVHLSCALDPKPERAYHEQGEPKRKRGGGPNPFAVQYIGMTCGKKWEANRAW